MLYQRHFKHSPVINRTQQNLQILVLWGGLEFPNNRNKAKRYQKLEDYLDLCGLPEFRLPDY